MKTIALIISLFFFNAMLGQVNIDTSQYCNDPISFDILNFENEQIQYKIAAKGNSLTTKKGSELYTLHIILPDYFGNSDKAKIQRIVNQMHRENKQYFEFIFFNNCKALDIYWNAIFPLSKDKAFSKEEAFYKLNYIGRFASND